MLKIIEVIKSLPKMSSYKPATQVQISDAEIELCLKFSEEYKAYLKEFGEISAKGIELTGIIDANYIDVVSVTKEKRLLYSQVGYNMYVVEDTFIDGIVIWQDSDGIIYKTSPNGGLIKIFDSLADYLKSYYL